MTGLSFNAITGKALTGKAILRLPAVLCLTSLLGACTLPPLDSRQSSHAIPASETRDTPLGKALAPRIDAHPGESGIHPLADAKDAFVARVVLARSAQRTLDIQYYIWRDDITGALLLNVLRDAAERGVRVRLLLDDNGNSGLDAELAALNSHPNFEVRLFNPFAVRKPKIIGFVTNFERANRRMHNKSFTADNQATIIGGRNIGDEYFGATEGVLFADLDVLAVGAVVPTVSDDFDRYWASGSSYPAELILPASDAAKLKAFAEAAAEVARQPDAAAYVQELRQSAFTRDLMQGTLAMEWAKTHMVSDDPAKGLGTASPATMLTYKVDQIVGVPKSNVELVSPYFVPTAAGVDAFASMVQSGVKVRVLTNSLHATDVAVVHAGYAKRRKDLLKAGVVLYEMRRLSTMGDEREEGGNRERPRGAGRFGSSGSSLHAKTFSVDGSRFFVGSFNFDPRSAHLNTELGFLIDSPKLAQQIEHIFDDTIPQSAYEVKLGEDGRLYWLEHRDGKQLRHDTEPKTNVWQRIGVKILALLPIEWLL
jgi:putative cardiolipin synthase